MSELIHTHDNRATIRWKLLTGASVLAVAAYVSSAALANAEDGDRPQVWIELGGQLSRLQDGQEIFAPPFVALTPPDFAPPQKAERPPLYGLDESAVLTFRPKDSDWTFSASINYGRAGSAKHVHHQSHPSPFIGYHKNTHTSAVTYRTFQPFAARFTDAAANQSESQAILDFRAGKDLGLGLLGINGVSSLSVGVRIAQFQSKSRVTLEEDPDWHFKTRLRHLGFFITQLTLQPYHTYDGMFHADRGFSGVGPSLSWKSSVPFAGNPQDGGLSLDWGVNAALLFGRQRTKTSHQTGGVYKSRRNGQTGDSYISGYHSPPVTHTRSRNVTVPNVGGFAGISWNYDSAKVSFGYKADFFFNAIDGGIDAAKKEDRGFYGPYASISIGLGD